MLLHLDETGGEGLCGGHTFNNATASNGGSPLTEPIAQLVTAATARPFPEGQGRDIRERQRERQREREKRASSEAFLVLLNLQ